MSSWIEQLLSRNKRGLQFVFGVVIFALIAAGFLIVGIALPIQANHLLQGQFSDHLVPAIGESFDNYNNAIKVELEAKLSATLADLEEAFNSENRARANAFAKSILPLVESFDYDGISTLAGRLVSGNEAVVGLQYRTEKDGMFTSVGDVQTTGLLSFSAQEASLFAYAEAVIFASPATLDQARAREEGAFASIREKTQNAKGRLLEEMKVQAASIRKGITSSLSVQIWILAAVLCTIVVAVTLFVLRKVVILPLQQTREHMLRIADGDLTSRIAVSTQNELGEMAEAGNKMIAALSEISQQIHGVTSQLMNSSNHLHTASDAVAQGTRRQSEDTDRVAVSVTEMAQTTLDVARNAADALDAAKDVSGNASGGRDVVMRTTAGMEDISKAVSDSALIIEQLGKSSDQIGSIVNVIDEIAEQTNLLALNAAIEAARAGEQGRGFAVVADEVRKLAERTGKATKEIGEMIRAIQADTKRSVDGMAEGQKQVDAGVALAGEAARAIEEIVGAADRATDMIQRIATATEEQSAAGEEISASVERIAVETRNSQEETRSIQEAAGDLSAMAEQLQAAVSWFKTGKGGGNPVPGKGTRPAPGIEG